MSVPPELNETFYVRQLRNNDLSKLFKNNG